MKKVIVAIQSTLVREAVIGALKKRGFFAEKSLSQLPDKVAMACDVFFADVLLMDAGRAAENSFERRMETVRCVRKNNPSLKTGLLCDNVSDPEIARKVKQARARVFFGVDERSKRALARLHGRRLQREGRICGARLR